MLLGETEEFFSVCFSVFSGANDVSTLSFISASMTCSSPTHLAQASFRCKYCSSPDRRHRSSKTWLLSLPERQEANELGIGRRMTIPVDPLLVRTVVRSRQMKCLVGMVGITAKFLQLWGISGDFLIMPVGRHRFRKSSVQPLFMSFLARCRRRGSNPHSRREHDFESCASASSATPAIVGCL